MNLRTFANYPPRKRMGLVAILLGVLAVFAGDPNGKTKTSINAKEIALASGKNVDRIEPADLADWIIKGKFDYRLIDVRNEKNFEKYNIPGSENIPVNKLLNSDLMRNDKIILYSDDEFAEAQAWFLLKAENYKGVYILDGGLKKWKDQILFPHCTCNENPTEDQKHHHAKLVVVSKFFGGKLQTGKTGIQEIQAAMPVPSAPKKITLKKTNGKKQREGC